MIRIGLVSDSHGHLDALKRAVDAMDVDLIFHMGDYVTDAEEIRHWTSTPVFAVKGNMDNYIDDRPDFIETEVDGHKVLCVHGHRQQVKGGTKRLIREAKKRGCDLAFFGHSHRRTLSEGNGVLAINPGSCALPSDGEKSYAILTIDGDDLDCRFYPVPD